MTGFVMRLHAADRSECIEGVATFVGEDRSGAFALWPRHAGFMTTLVFGLARFRLLQEFTWEYLALPGGVLYFVDNELQLATRRYFRHRDHGQIETLLQATLQCEEQDLVYTRQQLQHLEQDMLQRLWHLKRSGAI